MRISNNMAALNAWKNMSNNGVNLQRSLERLSSGTRINKAADDAAGLAVSEKMRSQMRGLSMAVRNTQDAVSLVQTAEGGASKVQDMLQRMRELAVQASSDTLQDTDRAQLHQEFGQLRSEIDRTSNTTEFNGISLLKGGGAGFGTTASNTSLATVAGAGTAASNLVVNVTQSAAKYTVTGTGNTYKTNTAGTDGEYRLRIKMNGGAAADVTLAVADGTTIDAAAVATAVNASAMGADANGVVASVTSDGHLQIVSKQTGTSQTLSFQEYYDADTASAFDTTDADTDGWYDNLTSNVFFAAGQQKQLATGQNLVGTVDNGTSVTALNGQTNSAVQVGGGSGPTLNFVAGATGRTEIKTIDNSTTTGITVQAGPNAANNTIALDIDALNLTTLNLSTLDISSKAQIGATTPLSTLETAISKVSTARAKMGAQQNRLENAISTLQTQSENLTAAESRIRDVDMAAEMAQFTKFQVLQQASTAMLAQANQLPQGIMSLLR